jgi:hypothetical protein
MSGLQVVTTAEEWGYAAANMARCDSTCCWSDEEHADFAAQFATNAAHHAFLADPSLLPAPPYPWCRTKRECIEIGYCRKGCGD